MIHYNSFRTFLKSKFGKPVLKIPLNGGFSCPNRDGTISSSGCFFCDNQSFSPAALKCNSPIKQLRDKITQFSGKISCFIPYLQPFSNTYGSVDKLRSVYEPLLSVDGVVGLTIGTRPDCFSASIYQYLEELSKRTYLSVELGLQSIHDCTLSSINRGHTFEAFRSAVNSLSKLNIETVAHVMLGLPGETEEMMLETARTLSTLPVNGVKIHQLMIIKGTVFEKWFLDKRIEPLLLETYTGILCKFLMLLRPDQHIHRLMADSKTELGLVAPLWSSEKTSSIMYIHNYMDKNCVKQGTGFGFTVDNPNRES